MIAALLAALLAALGQHVYTNADVEPYPSSIAVRVTPIPPLSSSIALNKRIRRRHERRLMPVSAAK